MGFVICLCVFEMADRFFPNEMPDFVAEALLEESSSSAERAKMSLTKLLSLPSKTLTDRLKSSAMDLKERVLLNLYIIPSFSPKKLSLCFSILCSFGF